jgi:hypothetical protein
MRRLFATGARRRLLARYQRTIRLIGHRVGAVLAAAAMALGAGLHGLRGRASPRAATIAPRSSISFSGCLTPLVRHSRVTSLDREIAIKKYPMRLMPMHRPPE